MVVKLKEETLKELNCMKIDLAAKPNLMAKAVNNEGTLAVVVDMIGGFCTGGALASERAAAVVKPIMAFCEKLDRVKKVFVRDCHGANAAEFRTFPPHCHTPAESAVVGELAGYIGLDVPKNSTNAIFALIKAVPDLAEYKNFLIVGVCSDICVMQLATSLKAYLNEVNAPRNVITFTDYVDTYDSPLHDAELMNLFAMKFMEDAGVQIFKNLL